MPTSGTINFSVTRDEIITEALEILGVLAEGQVPNADQLTSSSRTLNMIAKSWQAAGLNLFAVDRLYLFPAQGQREYSMSAASTDNVTSNYWTTTITSSTATIDNSVFLADVTDIVPGSRIGILSNNAIVWNSATSVNAISGEVGLANPVGVAVSVGTIVYAYTDVADRPMLVLEGYTIDDAQSRIPITVLSRREYNGLNSFSEGRTSQLHYDPQIGAGRLSLWPIPDDSVRVIELVVQRTLEDFVDANDNPDFPQEWYMPLAYALADNLAPKYGLPPQQAQMIKYNATDWYNKARDYDTELYTSIYFQPRHF